MKVDKKTIVAIVLCILAVIVIVMRLKSGFAPKKPAARSRAAQTTATAKLSTADSSSAMAAREMAAREEASLKAKSYSGYIDTLRESDLA